MTTPSSTTSAGAAVLGVDTGDLSNTDFPQDSEGRTYHVGVNKDEVAQRILSVGSLTRAEMLARTYLEKIECERLSVRGFSVFTGLYRGQRISIVGTGMGVSMMDFMVREVRGITSGPLVVVRLGTCGNLGTPEQLPTGSLAVCSKALFVSRDYQTGGYQFSPFVDADDQVQQLLMDKLPAERRRLVANASTDTFYAAQGRKECDFDDQNGSLLQNLRIAHPEVFSCEMEHFTLLHLAQTSKPHRKVHAGACAIVLSQRIANSMITKKEEHECERIAGKAVLDVLAEYQFSSS